MKNRLLLSLSFCIFSLGFTANAQSYKWLRVSELQSPINSVGAEYEAEFNNIVGTNSNFFAWQPQYSIDQNVARAKGLFIGCTNFSDPVALTTYDPKVIGSGPRAVAPSDQFFPVSIKLIGKFKHPTVLVDDAEASSISSYDKPDSYDETLPCDRMIVVKFNTSLGISVTKKVMVFSQMDQGNYFVNDYVFKNTGVYNSSGATRQVDLTKVWFMWHYRYAFGGVSSLYGSTWGNFNSSWGVSTLNHAFGEDPTSSTFNNTSSSLYKLRGFYSYYSPTSTGEKQSLSYDAEWGCPNVSLNGQLASAKYAGCVTLHADKSATDQTDNLYQPMTTYYISPDIALFTSANSSQYSQTYMSDRWTAMTEGHPAQQHDEIVGTTGTYAESWKSDSRRNSGGGVAMDQGFGPYDIPYGDSVHIAFAEAVSGIGWEKGNVVGSNWLQWYKYGSGETLTLPDGSTTTNYNAYKKNWIFTGADSILKTFQSAKTLYDADYSYAQAPPPPPTFTVTSGGYCIQLDWTAPVSNHLGGYAIYRAAGSVMSYKTVFEKVCEIDDKTVLSYQDTTPKRGNDYFYYIQSKDDGTQVSGKNLYSSLFWTLTNTAATLGRPAATALSKVRVVPNPYDIRARVFQFGASSMYDRIAFYGLPPNCDLRIYTENGELIWQKSHRGTTGDVLWNSKTSSGQIVASGIYILYVEVTGDTYDTWEAKDNRLLYRKGDSVFRKFVIIR
jgi:hypothetical protein